MSFNKIIDYLLVSLLIIVSITSTIYRAKLNSAISERDMALSKVSMLSANINIQNDAIKKLSDETIKENYKLIQAEKEAEISQNKYEKKSIDIIGTYVPNDCKSAMKWGVQEAIKIQESK